MKGRREGDGSGGEKGKREGRREGDGMGGEVLLLLTIIVNVSIGLFDVQTSANPTAL